MLDDRLQDRRIAIIDCILELEDLYLEHRKKKTSIELDKILFKNTSKIIENDKYKEKKDYVLHKLYYLKSGGIGTANMSLMDLFDNKERNKECPYCFGLEHTLHKYTDNEGNEKEICEECLEILTEKDNV